MEIEQFFSGYCRVLDGSRTVCAVKENGQLLEADCDYPSCPHFKECTISQSIQDFINKENDL